MAGAELHISLPQQRLLAQDRARVARHRRVLGVELDHRVGKAGFAIGGLLRDLAHVDPGDAHVGLLSELRGLGEPDVQLVAVRLERYRAAE